ncbi:MAG: GNAT family N-acetyltransferase [Oligoflexia bacterium]|nr:GNAT family N-acetyltransferase [Oligoflexia bacterium]
MTLFLLSSSIATMISEKQTSIKCSIQTRRLFIRNLNADDVSPRYLSWLKEQSIQQFICSRTQSIKDLIMYVTEKERDPAVLFLGVFDKSAGLHLGNIKFEPIDFSAKCTNFGILLAPEAGGQGIAQEACHASFKFVFETLGLEQVNLSLFADNKPALRLYEKLNFKIAGNREYQDRPVIDMTLNRTNFYFQNA